MGEQTLQNVALARDNGANQRIGSRKQKLLMLEIPTTQQHFPEKPSEPRAPCWAWAPPGPACACACAPASARLPAPTQGWRLAAPLQERPLQERLLAAHSVNCSDHQAIG